MSNKFLPFATKTSKPLQIYTLLLQRSKGVSGSVISAVTRIVLQHGIEDVRKFAASIDKVETYELYNQIVQRYQPPQDTDVYIKLCDVISRYLAKDEKSYFNESLDKLDLKQKLLYMTIMYKVEMYKEIKEHTSFFFVDMFNHYTKVFDDIPSHIKFSNAGEPVYFKNKDELTGYVLFEYFKTPEEDPDREPIRAVILPATDEAPF